VYVDREIEFEIVDWDKFVVYVYSHGFGCIPAFPFAAVCWLYNIGTCSGTETIIQSLVEF
jgi:hypothetical protein